MNDGIMEYWKDGRVENNKKSYELRVDWVLGLLELFVLLGLVGLSTTNSINPVVDNDAIE